MLFPDYFHSLCFHFNIYESFQSSLIYSMNMFELIMHLGINLFRRKMKLFIILWWTPLNGHHYCVSLSVLIRRVIVAKVWWNWDTENRVSMFQWFTKMPFFSRALEMTLLSKVLYNNVDGLQHELLLVIFFSLLNSNWHFSNLDIVLRYLTAQITPLYIDWAVFETHWCG